jgi:hypothetical protein
MSLQFDCSACGRPLSVSDAHANTQVQCPQCGAVLPVPSVAENSPDRTTLKRWKVRIPEGQTYGPIERAELDQWAAEGRLDGNCMLQATGETVWLHAIHEYPHLTLHPQSTASTAAASSMSTAFIRPHRGGMLLTFGILGIVFVLMSCVPLGLFSPVAWFMSHKDLKAIREGEMDRRGEGLAQAGRVLGIVGTILFVLYLLVFLAYAAFIVFFVGQAIGGPFGPPGRGLGF